MKGEYAHFLLLSHDTCSTEDEANKVSINMLLLLILPSLSDAVATVLAYIGLRYIPSSIYQMMKSTIIVFVALFKVIDYFYYMLGWLYRNHIYGSFDVITQVTVLGHSLHQHMWFGVFLNTCGM